MATLQTTLDQLRARLEAALQISDARAEPWVALTNPVDPDRRVAESARNKMVMVLVGLQNDPTRWRLAEDNRASSRARRAAAASERVGDAHGQFQRE